MNYSITTHLFIHVSHEVYYNQPLMRYGESRVKVICKSPHDWPKLVIHSKSYITLFLTHYNKGRKWSSIAHFPLSKSRLTSPQWTYGVTQTRGGSIMTSYPSIVLVLTDCHKADIHDWITTVIYRLPSTRYSRCSMHEYNFWSLLRSVKLVGYSISDIGHSNVQCPISNTRLTSHSS